MVIKLYVEGGGNAASLKAECRKGFNTFLGKAGLKDRMPRIVACGSRADAYDSFQTAIRNGEAAMLLVDSEAPVSAQSQPGDPSTRTDREHWLPWLHLRHRQGDGWEKPNGSTDLQCHLMVQCMEAWLVADPDTLQTYFGQGFQRTALPNSANHLETLGTATLYRALGTASKNCKTKRAYNKGTHSFALLALIDPNKVINASPWAKRFIEEIRKQMGQQ